MDPIEQTLVATQNLLCALEQDSSLLRDKNFMERLTYLRKKHKETSDSLLKQTQFPSRDHVNGATYHRSPGCNHYWSTLPLQFNYPRNTANELEEPNTCQKVPHQRPRGNSFQDVLESIKRPIVQDAATIVKELKDYNRTLRNQRIKQLGFQSDSKVENSKSYQTLPRSAIQSTTQLIPSKISHRSLRSEITSSRHLQSEVIEEDDLRTIGKSNSQSTTDFRDHGSRTISRKESVSSNKTLLKKKANSVQDLSAATNKRQQSRPSSSNVTVPRPFTFMQRKYKGNTYARKFLEKMLDEKEQKEKEKFEEEEKIKKPFKAHPIPSTTYKSSNPRVEDKRYVEAVRKKLDSNLKLRSTLIRSESLGDVTKFSIRPVPATTYIAPDLHAYRRGRESNRRAVLLLAEAHSPAGLKEHAYRTNVSFYLRHQHCRENVNVKKFRRQSVPDFRRLHREFNDKLEKIYSSKPPTVPTPFNLSENTKKHKHCSSVSPQRIYSRRLSPAYVPVFPVHETHSSLLRTASIRKRIDQETKSIEKKKQDDAEHDIEMELQRQKLRRSMGKEKSDDIEKKVEDKRRALAETTREYERTLRDIKQKVLTRPLVMDQQSTSAQQSAIERKYKEAMSTVTGISKSKAKTDKIDDSKTLIVPSLLRRNSGATGDTFSVKSKRSSINSSSKSDKEEYNMSFESDASSSKTSSGSSSSGKSRNIYISSPST